MISSTGKKSVTFLTFHVILVISSAPKGRKVPTKHLFEQEAPEIETQKCLTKRRVRERWNVGFAPTGREVVKTEVFKERVQDRSVRGENV